MKAAPPEMLQNEQTLKLVLAALVGGMIAIPFAERMPFWKCVAALFSGMAMAYISARPVASLFPLNDPDWPNVVALIMGLFGRAACFTLFMLISDHGLFRKILLDRLGKQEDSA